MFWSRGRLLGDLALLWRRRRRARLNHSGSCGLRGLSLRIVKDALAFDAFALDAFALDAFPLGALSLCALSLCAYPFRALPLGTFSLDTFPLGASCRRDAESLGMRGPRVFLSFGVGNTCLCTISRIPRPCCCSSCRWAFE